MSAPTRVLWIVNIVLPAVAEDLGLNKTPFGGWLTLMTDRLALRDDFRIGTLQHLGKRFPRALPHPAEVAAWRLGRSRSQRKRAAPPAGRMVEVDLEKVLQDLQQTLHA